MYAFLKNLAALLCVAACVLTASYSDAQLLRRQIVPTPQVPAAQPTPAVSTQPAQQPGPPAVDNAAQAAQTTAPAPIAEGNAQGRLIRGHNLIGMNIWGSNQQQVGTIQDFVIEDQPGGGCPSIFFAVTPQIAGWNQGYVIVPFNAFQVGYDNGLRSDRFTLNVTAEALGRAPHMAADRWNSGQDRQFLTDSRQFFQRTERTAARPETGGKQEERPQLPADQQRPNDANRGQQPAAGQQVPEARQPEARQPEAARQPETEPRTTPPSPEPSRERPEDNHRR